MAFLRTLHEVIFILQGEACFYCNQSLPNKPTSRHDEPGWTRDHVVPHCSGTHLQDNVLLVCFACNSKKGHAMPSAEKIAYAQALYQRARRIHEKWRFKFSRIPVSQRRHALCEMILRES